MNINKIIIPEGWEVEKVENGEIILKETKKNLPKTYEECYKLLDKREYVSSCSNIEPCTENEPYNRNHNILPKGLGRSMLALVQLLVCREVYRQGWEPNWSDDYIMKHCIFYDSEICTGVNYNEQRVLSFQTKEIRDKFLENFRDLIEKAKELI